MKRFKIHLKKGNIPDSHFDKKQLRIGMKVESEHSNDKYITKQIAKGHLAGESPNYYKYLAKMEKEIRRKEGKT